MTDSLYQKMILSLPESFFEGWQWEAGDKGLNINEYSATEIIFLGYTGQFADCIIPSSGNFRAGLLPEELRPLPNQKQLQSMLNLSPIEFIEDFYAYSQEPLKENVDPMQFKTDLECFTLAYVMDRKFKKEFNGDEWIQKED